MEIEGQRQYRERAGADGGGDGACGFARVRARFGVDPEIPSQLFAGAWTAPSGAVEEDEAEFVDAMADCMSAGLPLGAAIMFWASGALARGEDDDQGNDDDRELGAIRPARDPSGRVRRPGGSRPRRDDRPSFSRTT